jgi:nucleoredoxin
MEELSQTVESNGFDVNEKTSVIVMCDGATPEVQAQASSALLSVAEELSVCEDPDFIFFTACHHAGPVPQVKTLLSLPEELVETPIIVILDIPDNGGFYIVKPDAITPESIKSTLDKYSTKQLQRKQLKK